jgi:hypothetical protein
MTCKYKQCSSSDDGQHCYHQEGYSSGSTSKCCHCGRVENNYPTTLPRNPNGTSTPSPIWIIPTAMPYYPGVTYFTCNAR